LDDSEAMKFSVLEQYNIPAIDVVAADVRRQDVGAGIFQKLHGLDTREGAYLDMLVGIGESLKPEFDTAILQLAKECSAETLLAPVKGWQRMQDKCHTDNHDTARPRGAESTDVLRASVVFETPESMAKFRSMLLNKYKKIREKNGYIIADKSKIDKIRHKCAPYSGSLYFLKSL